MKPAEVAAGDTGRHRALLGPARELAAQNEALLEKAVLSVERASRLLEQDREQRLQSVPPSRPRVLIVDDDKLVLKTACHVLKKLEVPAAIEIAGSVKVALEKIGAGGTPYQVIVLDYRLANGLASDVLRAARRRSALTWIILMSGYLTAATGPQTARSMGANDWLPKPLDRIDDLLYAVQKGLGKFEAPSDRPPEPRDSAGSYRMIDLKRRR